MLLAVLDVLKTNLPCSENFYHFRNAYIKKMEAKGESVKSTKTKKLASPMMRSLSPTAGSRKSSGDGESMGGASMLSGVAGKVDLDKFKSRAEERKRRAAETEAVVSSADPDSPSMHADSDFVRLANRRTATGGAGFASPSHVLNPGAARAEEEVK